MKNEALKRGAEEAPISLTGGIESGRGVVSMRTFWLNLCHVRMRLTGGGVGMCREAYLGWRAAIVRFGKVIVVEKYWDGTMGKVVVVEGEVVRLMLIGGGELDAERA